MATITLPNQGVGNPGPTFNNVSCRRVRAQWMQQSPISHVSQVQVFDGTDIWICSFQLPPLNKAQVTRWIDFFEDLNGFENIFQFDPTDAMADSTKSPGLIDWMLTSPNNDWTKDDALLYGISFEAMEAL